MAAMGPVALPCKKGLSADSLEILHDLWTSHELCDAILRLEDGDSFPVHRAILSACSPFFRTLFTTALSGSPPVQLLVHGVSAGDMAAILNYAYLRDLDVDEDSVCDVLIASDYLSVLGAKNRCCDYIKAALNPENCIAIVKFARFYACAELEEQARKYMLQHFTLVSQESQDLLHLSMDELCTIIRDDELNVWSEEVVWECVLRWLQHDLQERRPHLPHLLGCVRLGLLDTKYFITHVKKHELVAGDPRCRPIIISILKYLYDVSSQSEEHVAPPHAWPRLPYELLFVIGGWSAGTPTSCIEVYDCRADHWMQVDDVDPEGPRAYHGVAALGTDIYIIGGYNGVSYFNSCRCFDTECRKWREIAPMNSRRCYVNVAVLDGEIYAMGGYDRPHRQSSAERYNPLTNQWTFIPSMTVQRSDANATTLNGLIYVVGGFTGVECLSSAEVYDPQLQQWRLIANMTSRRSGVSCVAHHGCVYVVGGFNGISRLSSAEMYDPRTNTWARIADMLQTRSNFALEVVDDALYAIGGFNGVTTTASVECYDESSNQWYEVSQMNQFRSALSAGVVRGLINMRQHVGSRACDTKRHHRPVTLREISLSSTLCIAIANPEEEAHRNADPVQGMVDEESNHEYMMEEDGEDDAAEANQQEVITSDVEPTPSSMSI